MSQTNVTAPTDHGKERESVQSCFVFVLFTMFCITDQLFWSIGWATYLEINKFQSIDPPLDWLCFMAANVVSSVQYVIAYHYYT